MTLSDIETPERSETILASRHHSVLTSSGSAFPGDPAKCRQPEPTRPRLSGWWLSLDHLTRGLALLGLLSTFLASAALASRQALFGAVMQTRQMRITPCGAQAQPTARRGNDVAV